MTINAIGSNKPIEISFGGTNATSMATTDGVVYFDGTRLVTTAVGTATNVLTSNGAGMAPTFQALPSSSITLTGDTGGGLTGTSFTIKAGQSSQNAGSSVKIAGSGTTLTLDVTDANSNTIIGNSCGNSSLSGSYNFILGSSSSGASLTSSGANCVIGALALNTLTSGNGANIAIGFVSLRNLATGAYNIALGYGSGANNYTGAESHNILLNTDGVTSESNVLRIGAGTGTGTQQLNKAIICGINGITVTGTAVLVSASDQLGIAVSSQRFKENIKPLESTKVLELQPVSFNYKVGDDHSPQTGLIAEQVYKIIPELVVLDKEGLPQSVKYNDLPVLLLLEIQKLKNRIDQLESE